MYKGAKLVCGRGTDVYAAHCKTKEFQAKPICGGLAASEKSIDLLIP